MKLLTKTTSVALALALCASLFVACGNTATSESTSETTSDATTETQTMDYSARLDDNGYFKDVVALDYITLPEDFDSITLSEEAATVTDEYVQTEIDNIANSLGSAEQLTEGTIADGDVVNIAYVGSVDGVEFAGGATGEQGTMVVAGDTNYIDDFLTQIIGHDVGENFDIEVTFPDEYPNNPDLAGKDAIFNITVNFISGEWIVPEITDEFVATQLQAQYGWTTVQEMRDQIKDVTLQNQMRSFIMTYMMDNSEVKEIPQEILDFHAESLVAYTEATAAQYSMDLAAYLAATGSTATTAEELIESQKESLDTMAKTSLLMQAIAEKAGIETGEDELVAYFETAMGTTDYSMYEELYGMPYLVMTVSNENCLQHLVDSAK